MDWINPKGRFSLGFVVMAYQLLRERPSTATEILEEWSAAFGCGRRSGLIPMLNEEMTKSANSEGFQPDNFRVGRRPALAAAPTALEAADCHPIAMT
jgi:hypothetical protein